MREDLVKANPGLPMIRSGLAQSVRRFGLLRGATGDTAGAVALARQAAALLEGIQSRSAEQWYELACCYAALAGLATRQGVADFGRSRRDRGKEGNGTASSRRGCRLP